MVPVPGNCLSEPNERNGHHGKDKTDRVGRGCSLPFHVEDERQAVSLLEGARKGRDRLAFAQGRRILEVSPLGRMRRTGGERRGDDD